MKDFNDQAKVLRDEFIKSGIKSSSTSTIRGTIKSPESGESDVPPGLIRDPQTKVIRRKREGE
jgi:hypothetical protein